jgi:hypothetical protein
MAKAKLTDWNSASIEESRNLLNGRISSSDEVMLRRDMMRHIQQYIDSCIFLSINPLVMLRKTYTDFTWQYVDLSGFTELTRDCKLQSMISQADYFWEDCSGTDIEWYVARRKNCSEEPWKIFGSLNYEFPDDEDKTDEDRWSEIDDDKTAILKDAGAVICPG